MLVAYKDDLAVLIAENTEEIEESGIDYNSVKTFDFAELYHGVIYTDIVSLEEAKKAYIRKIRNEMLKDSDGYGALDRPQTEDVISHQNWREYLRDYTKSENWWLSRPLQYEEWLSQ